MTAYLQCTGRRASNMRSHAERGNEGNKYARKNQSWTIIVHNFLQKIMILVYSETKCISIILGFDNPHYYKNQKSVKYPSKIFLMISTKEFPNTNVLGNKGYRF